MPLKFDSKELNLSNKIINVIKEMEFDELTPVQEAVIPNFMNHKDVAVEACTGSGKTLAYIIPVIEILERCKNTIKNSIGGIVILPTRELAQQVFGIFNQFLDEFENIKSFLFVGGRDVNDDLEELKQEGTLIIVGTPGRLNDIFNKMDDSKLKTIEILILDEADVLLDKGFRDVLNLIIEKIPKQRRTGLFSATLTSVLFKIYYRVLLN